MTRKKRLSYPHSYLLIIKRYLSEKRQVCFTYRGLRAWLYKHAFYRDVEWHTFERTIRKLAEDGYLERRSLRGLQVIFCWTESAENVVRRALESIYGNDQLR